MFAVENLVSVSDHFNLKKKQQYIKLGNILNVQNIMLKNAYPTQKTVDS